MLREKSEIPLLGDRFFKAAEIFRRYRLCIGVFARLKKFEDLRLAFRLLQRACAVNKRAAGGQHIKGVGKNFRLHIRQAFEIARRFQMRHIRVAADRARRKDLRATLRQRMQASPLFDADGLARALESQYLSLSLEHQAQ